MLGSLGHRQGLFAELITHHSPRKKGFHTGQTEKNHIKVRLNETHFLASFSFCEKYSLY